MAAEPNVPPDAVKTVVEMKKERYAKFLADSNRQAELEQQERTQALGCMMKIMNHQLNAVKETTKELQE